jgi:type I restriction enzyme, S subunit
MSVSRLDSVCDVIMGQAPNGEAYNKDGKGWLLIAGAGDFGELYPAPKKSTTEASKLSRPGDIILGIRATIGEKVLSDGEYCLGRGVTALRAKAMTDSRYLWHWVEHARPKLASKAKGATFKQVSRQDICELEISLPPIAQQKRIAAILDQAEALRSLRRQSIGQLDALGRSVFLEMFGDPVTNPKKWETPPMREVAVIERGKFTPRPRNDPSYYGGEFPFIQTGDISSAVGKLNSWTQTLNKKGIRVSRSFLPGTIVVAIVGATIGMSAILGIEVYCPDSVVGIQVFPEKAVAEYLEMVLQYWRPVFIEQAPATARANINLETFRPLQVPLPPLTLQQEFADRIQAIEALKAQHRESLAKMDTLFASLQHRAFRGEL